jgi:hypothetical protein
LLCSFDWWRRRRNKACWGWGGVVRKFLVGYWMVKRKREGTCMYILL